LRPISAIVVSALLLVACGQGDDHRHPMLKTGKQLYEHHCASCHRDAGEGTFVRGVPAVKDTSMTYRQMADHVRGHGRARDTRMPEFSTMSKAEAQAIAVYIRGKLGTG